jgi:hypothetical protein
MQTYEIALGVALIIIGAVLVFVALILRYRETEPLDHPHDADAGDLGEFADSLQRTDEANANVRPRIGNPRQELRAKGETGTRETPSTQPRRDAGREPLRASHNEPSQPGSRIEKPGQPHR